ncbi:MAG: UDP-N-acetylmuramate--L-alanine ligase [Patescibacteria group bacterium]|nr:UDP-N-acetylmuramate--L-alanine ligase [Patescibacteria group bacterium]
MELDLSKINKIFFLGIGGIGISAIARMMLLEGKTVLGSDIGENEITAELEKFGALIATGQDLTLIPQDVDLIVYTIAVPRYDPKLFKEVNDTFNVPVLSYPQMLGIVTRNKNTVAVSGTHGKTTTTAMIAQILIDTDKDPSVIIGSFLKESNSNLIVGKSDIFVVEACEYERSFLNLKPKILVITNIEPDHLDYYKDIADIESAFSELVMQTENFIICNTDDPAIKNVLQNESSLKYKAKVINYLTYLDKVPKLSVPGDHNRMNAACALAVAEILKIPEEVAQRALGNFKGTWRRLEEKGQTKEGVIIYDDYAHHPTEIKASLQALREIYPYSAKNITVLFQPHLYSRTKALFNDFAKSFKGADRVFILPIYFAREEKDDSISSEKLAEAIRLAGEEAQAFSTFELAEKATKGLNLGPKDVFVTMGAGEANKVTKKVFEIV